MSPQWLGVDVGGTHTRIGVDDGAADELVRRLPTPPTWEALVDAVRAARDEAQHRAPVAAIGVGVPGTVDRAGACWTPNVAYLCREGVAAQLRAALDREVLVANDAQLALLAEARRGAATGCADAALIVAGTGVGGAIMRGGRLVRGARGGAGAFGWLLFDLDDAGNAEHGHLERIASGSALRARAGVGAAAGADEDHVDEALLDDAAATLGAATATVASALDPDVVVVGGGLGMRLQPHAASLRAAHHRHASPAGRQIPVVWSEMGDRAGTVGAALAAREGPSAWL